MQKFSAWLARERIGLSFAAVMIAVLALCAAPAFAGLPPTQMYGIFSTSCSTAQGTSGAIPLAVDGNGALCVHLTGSLTASSASVGLTGATAPTSADLIGTIDGSGKLQGASTSNPVPVSAASLPLPTGAATSAKQPALGTAGTPSADVLTVQGGSGGTPLNSNVSQLGGTTIATGAGATSAGTQRTVTASDSPDVSSLSTISTNTTTTAGRGKNFQKAPTITVQNAAYSAGYSMGGLITVSGVTSLNGGGGLVDAIRLRSAGGATNTIWIYAWSKSPASTCTDKATFVSSAGDGAYALPGFPVSVTLGNSPGSWDTYTYAATSGNLSAANFVNQDTSPGTSIYLCLVTAGSVTPATTSDLSMVVGGIAD